MADRNKMYHTAHDKDRQEDIPAYRAYGVKKRVTVFTHLNDLIAIALAVVLVVLYGSAFLIGSIMLTLWLGHIGIALVTLGALLFVYFKLLRKLRKRAKFMIRLKKKCKQLGYKLEIKRGVFKGLRLNKEGFDFILKTEKKLWCVRFYTPKKRLSHITFINKDTIEIETNIVKSRLKFVLNMNKDKKARETYSFDDVPPLTSLKKAKALIINPVPHEVFKIDQDGAKIAIGSGEYLYGYTMFTGSGFLQTITRESEE